MKTNHYPNKMASHFVTIVPMTTFTLKSTSKFRSFHVSFPLLIQLNFNNYYDNGFHNTFDYATTLFID